MNDNSIKKHAKNVLEKVMRETWKNMKNGTKKGAKMDEIPEKRPPKTDPEKSWIFDAKDGRQRYAAAPQEDYNSTRLLRR